MHNRKAVTKVLYHAFVVLFGFMMVYPVLWMISGSFKGNAEILRGTLSLIPKELKLTNYATGWKGFGGTTFATFFTNSIFITVIATFGTVISSSLVAYALSRVRFRGRKFWFTCMLVTMMLPTQVIMIPQYLIYYRLGLVPGYVPLILPYFCGQAFFIYQMMQFMQGIPKDLDEAATIDGCSKYQIYSRIILPLMKPSIVTTVIIQFYWKWDDYMGPLLYLSRPQSYYGIYRHQTVCRLCFHHGLRRNVCYVHPFADPRVPDLPVLQPLSGSGHWHQRPERLMFV